MSQKNKWKVIGRGKVGWHAKAHNVSLSECYGPEYPAKLAGEAEEGALVYDAKNADTSKFIDLVVGGPLLDVSLNPDEHVTFSKELRKTALNMVPALEGVFKAYALAAQDEKFGALDTVGIGVYEGLLRKVPGIKIGHVINGMISWEES